MTIKKLFTFGDSFVMGSGLETNPNVISYLSWPEIKESDPETTSVIFTWTGIARTCLFDEKIWDYYNVVPGYQDPKGEIIKIQEFYYMYVHRDFDALMNLYIQINTVATYLTQLGVKWFMVKSFNEGYDVTKIARFPKTYYNRVPKEKFFLGWDNGFHDQICKKEGFICNDKYHPSEAGHLRIAELMNYYMKQEKII